MKSFWNCDRLFFEDLPTVRDLIWSADWDILSREVSSYYASDGTDPEAAAARVALEQMMDLEVREPSEKWVFLPNEYYSVSGAPEAIDRHIDAVLVRRRDFKLMEDLSSREELLFSANDCRKCLKRETKRLGNKYPDLYGWSLTSWKKTLSYRVWMQGEYSRKERYQALATIVQEMMFFGNTWDEARHEQRLTKKRLKRDAKSVGKARVKGNPAELLLRNYGLESTTDDYQSAYDARLQDTVLVLNHNVSVDLHRRVADFSKRIRRAEKYNEGPQLFSLDRW